MLSKKFAILYAINNHGFSMSEFMMLNYTARQYSVRNKYMFLAKLFCLILFADMTCSFIFHESADFILMKKGK